MTGFETMPMLNLFIVTSNFRQFHLRLYV